MVIEFNEKEYQEILTVDGDTELDICINPEVENESVLCFYYWRKDDTDGEHLTILNLN